MNNELEKLGAWIGTPPNPLKLFLVMVLLIAFGAMFIVSLGVLILKLFGVGILMGIVVVVILAAMITGSILG